MRHFGHLSSFMRWSTIVWVSMGMVGLMACEDSVINKSKANTAGSHAEGDEDDSLNDEEEGTVSIERRQTKSSEELTIAKDASGKISLGSTSIRFSEKHSATNLKVKLRRATAEDLTESDQVFFGSTNDIVVLEVFDQSTNQRLLPEQLTDLYWIDYKTTSDRGI